MSKHAATIINAIPGIENMRYLELGIGCEAKTINQVNAVGRVGVDISLGPFQTGPRGGIGLFRGMTTDQFFEGCAAPGYNVIFIDADHSYDAVRRDYNNAMKFLDPHGMLLISNLNPPDEAHQALDRCGDGWKFLIQLTGPDPEYKMLDDDHGLTCIPFWRSCSGKVVQFERIAGYEELHYDDFMPRQRRGHPLVTLQGMLEWVRNRRW